MKVGYTQNGTIGGAPVKKKGASSASGASFADFMNAAEAEETSSTGAASATGSLSSLMAVQEVGERKGGRKRAAKQANLTLDALDELRHALLMGEVPMHMLRAIADRLAEQKASVSDGPLLQVMKEIEVRAAVELAKLEQAARPS